MLSVKIVRLGAERVHAGALELLDNERREFTAERRLGGAIGGHEHRLGKRQAPLVREARAVDVGSLLVGVVVLLGIDKDHFLETVTFPVTNHFIVAEIRHHRVMFLAVAVPDQHRQKIRHLRKSDVEVQHRIEHVRLAHAAVTDGHREQRARMQQRTAHGEVLALPERTGRRENARDGARQMAEQSMLLAEAVAHLLHAVDAHGLKRGVEEHGAVVAGRVMADLGDDIGVAEHHQCRVGIGAGGKAARMPGGLGTGDLQREVTQCVGHEQCLVCSAGVIRLADRLVAAGDDRGPRVLGKAGPRLAEMLDALAEPGNLWLGLGCYRCGARHGFLLGPGKSGLLAMKRSAG